MNFLNPRALAWGALALPILLLYFLRLRRKEVIVSSTFLWQRLLLDRQANTPWQRIQRNLLLFIQLSILLMLVLGLARPALDRLVVASGSVIVLLDGSLSMQATDVAPTRFDAAISEALQLVQALGPDDTMTVILVSANPEIIAAAETDRSILSTGLRAAQASSTEADWRSAMALAAGAYQSGELDATTVIISDGGLGPNLIPPFPGELRYIPIGVSGENLGITAMAARLIGGETQLLTQVSNFGQEDRTVLLSIYSSKTLLSARRLTVAAGQTELDLHTGLPERQAEFSAHLSSPGTGADPIDWLENDNWGYAVVRPPSTGRVLLVGDGNYFLEQLLASIPGITAFRTLASDLNSEPDPGIRGFDLIIYDRVGPDLKLPNNALLIDPPDNELFHVSGTFQPNLASSRATEHPLARFVNWDQVHVQSASIIETPAWAEVLVTAGQNPLVLIGQHADQRIAVLTFDLLDSDLALQTAFPVLFANLLTYLLPGPQADFPESLLPGTSLNFLPLDTLEGALVRSPSGEVIWGESNISGDIPQTTKEPGIYTISYQDGDTAGSVAFAVNLFSPLEGTIQPAPSLTIGRTAIDPRGTREYGQQEIWRLFALAAILLLTLEWWVYQRGVGSAAPVQTRQSVH